MRQSLLTVLEKDLPKHGELVAGRYLVAEMLGSGGMSAVFKVSHFVTKKLFAMKWMLPSLRSEPDAVQRFIREAQVAGKVDHPNVVEVYDFGQQAESFFMVMEFLQGESLAGRLATGRLTPAEACAVLVPTARGVAAAHAAGVIHRDLKPHNVFLSRASNGELVPKVLDFGVSKLTQLHEEIGEAITREGDIVGTPHYMAPEQLRAQSIDERADVYGLGVILYESLTGELPFLGTSYSELILNITTETPRPVTERAPDTPHALLDIVARAMARDRAQRFSSVQELADALERVGADVGFASPIATSATLPVLSSALLPKTPLSGESRRPVQLQQISRTRRKRGISALAIALAVIALGIALRAFLPAPATAPGAGTETRHAAAVSPAAAITPPARASAEAEMRAVTEPSAPNPTTASSESDRATSSADLPPSSTTESRDHELSTRTPPGVAEHSKAHTKPPAARSLEPASNAKTAKRPAREAKVEATASPAQPKPVEKPPPSSQTRRTRELSKDDF